MRSRCAPTEFHPNIDAFGGEILLRDLYQFRGDRLAFQIFRTPVFAILWHRKHPTHFAAALLGVSQAGHAFHVQTALHHPVDAGQPGVKNALLHVARHLLRPNQHAFNFAVVDLRKIRAPIRVNAPACALKERNRGILQTAFRDSKLQLLRLCRHARTPIVVSIAIGRVKQLTVPS
jgi:hypothetical protein